MINYGNRVRVLIIQFSGAAIHSRIQCACEWNIFLGELNENKFNFFFYIATGGYFSTYTFWILNFQLKYSNLFRCPRTFDWVLFFWENEFAPKWIVSFSAFFLFRWNSLKFIISVSNRMNVGGGCKNMLNVKVSVSCIFSMFWFRTRCVIACVCSCVVFWSHEWT